MKSINKPPPNSGLSLAKFWNYRNLMHGILQVTISLYWWVKRWYTNLPQVKEKHIFSMHRNLPLYLCPNTELLLSDAHPHDQIKSPQSNADLSLMCLFLDLYYNGNKIMINNDPRSHYLVALIIKYLKAFANYLHRELHPQLRIHIEESHQLTEFSFLYLIGPKSNTDLILSALLSTLSCYVFSSIHPS